MTMADKKIKAAIANDEIRTAICGAAFWLSDGIFLSEEDAEALSKTDFPFDLAETHRARKIQAKMMNH